MKKSDINFFMHLMDTVGWDMTDRDYDRILKFSSNGCFIAEREGKALGIISTISYGNIAWIGNLVVVPESRGQGIGTELMRYAINHLFSLGAKSIKLDGVHLAIPFYHRLGFKDEYWSLRYSGVAIKHPNTSCKPMIMEVLEKVAALDLSIFKAPRYGILKYYFELFPELCFTTWNENELVGYIMAKKGKKQFKVGPWIVKKGYDCEAEQLLYSVMNKIDGENMWIGVPEANKTSISILEKNGFTRQPSSLRMCKGDCNIIEEINSVFGLGGPDKG